MSMQESTLTPEKWAGSTVYIPDLDREGKVSELMPVVGGKLQIHVEIADTPQNIHVPAYAVVPRDD